MKTTRIFLALSILGIFLSFNTAAQTPQKLSYQAIVRNASNSLVVSSEIGIRISILQGSPEGVAVYSEFLNTVSNANGLVSVEIGTGTGISGVFSAIDWSMGNYFVKTEIDPTGGTEYTITGTSQLLSVPYALHAKTAESLTEGINETDPLFEQSATAGITEADTANWNSKLDSYTETDPQFEQSVAAAITQADTANWNNKLDSYTETDPQFGQSVAAGITQADTSNWNNKQDPLEPGAGISISGNVISAINTVPQYSVGDFAHGGIVFWVDESGQHGLVCSKSDQSGGIRWFAGTYGNTQSKGNGPLSGKLNTSIIISSHVAIGDDNNAYAARLCNELQILEGGRTYGDWYLPSTEELKLMHQHRAVIQQTALANGGSNFADAYYWSSTELNFNFAQRLNFECGCQGSNNKDGLYRVRAIRAF